MSAQPIEIEVENIAGIKERVSVHGPKVAQWQEASLALAAGDEIRLVELCCDKPRTWAHTLTPESYTDLAKLVDERSQSFFAFIARNTARAMFTDKDYIRREMDRQMENARSLSTIPLAT